MGADHFIWQSFDYPGDTMLPNMVLGYNRKSGKSSVLTAWKNENDPSTGIFSAAGGLVKEMPGQVIKWMNRSTPNWKSGPWDQSSSAYMIWITNI
ncbi:putative non-specific protein-tyrosine kinase [Rosa chinensis]|uniref:Putative non-specific protein-tyrosine kinase n=1 Tax=Rosa chinensis TaxID=74649 RepID=A0A2P6Q3F2_ROSCH|nr:putative non-specific protein-tyrosine kinase [Rosa chinensis]